MYLAIRARHMFAAAAVSVLVSAAFPAAAQEPSDSHIKAARGAIDAMRATEQFDGILPQAAHALKAEMTQKNPDLVQIIAQIVDEETLALAARRGDLEREAALIYTKFFTEPQLNEITAFYTSETGKKLLADGAVVARQIYEAAGVWQRGVARDLAQNVGNKLSEVTKANAPTDQSAVEGGDEQGQANN